MNTRLYDEGLLFSLHNPDNTVIFGQVQDRDFVLQKISDLLAQVHKEVDSVYFIQYSINRLEQIVGNPRTVRPLVLAAKI